MRIYANSSSNHKQLAAHAKTRGQGKDRIPQLGVWKYTTELTQSIFPIEVKRNG